MSPNTTASGVARAKPWRKDARDSRDKSRWLRTEPPKQTIPKQTIPKQAIPPKHLAVALAEETMDDQLVARELEGRPKAGVEVGVSKVEGADGVVDDEEVSFVSAISNPSSEKSTSGGEISDYLTKSVGGVINEVRGVEAANTQENSA